MSDSTNQNPKNDSASDEPVSETPIPAGGGEDEAVEAAPATESVAEEANDDAEPVAANPEDDSADAVTPATPAAAPAVRVRKGKKVSDRPTRGPLRPPVPAALGSYAVIETGGKQYRVSVGDRITVEKLAYDSGSEITIDKVLLVSGDGSTEIGTPTIAGASVTATVDEHFRGEKIVVFKFKAKKRYRRKTGHRQSLTRLSITGIRA